MSAKSGGSRQGNRASPPKVQGINLSSSFGKRRNRNRYENANDGSKPKKLNAMTPANSQTNLASVGSGIFLDDCSQRMITVHETIPQNNAEPSARPIKPQMTTNLKISQ